MIAKTTSAPRRLENLSAIVSAGGSGIGRNIAEVLVKHGARVAVCDISDEALTDLPRLGQAGHSSSIFCAQVDATKAKDVNSFVDSVANQFGGIDLLVNNVGVSGPTKPVDQISDDEWRNVMSANIDAHFFFVRAALQHLKKSSNASVVNMSSTAGRMGMPLRVPYSVSKYAARGLTDSLTVELGDFGIRVNAILPGIVDGPRAKRVVEEQAENVGMSYEEYLPFLLHNVSMHKSVPPQEIGELVAFLASPEAGSISGQSISICGNLETYRRPRIQTSHAGYS